MYVEVVAKLAYHRYNIYICLLVLGYSYAIATETSVLTKTRNHAELHKCHRFEFPGCRTDGAAGVQYVYSSTQEYEKITGLNV